MATALTDLQFGGLIKCLIQEGVLNKNDATVHTAEAKKNKTPLVSHLVANNIVDSKK